MAAVPGPAGVGNGPMGKGGPAVEGGGGGGGGGTDPRVVVDPVSGEG